MPLLWTGCGAHLSILTHIQGFPSSMGTLGSGWPPRDGGQVLLPENQYPALEEVVRGQCC